MKKFISVDPLASVTRDIYTYANNNPLNQSDPLGLMANAPGFNTFGAVDCVSPMTLSPEEENYGPSFILSIPVATVCVFVCVGLSLNFAHNGMYLGWTKGVGFRAEASVGASIGVGKTLGKENMSVECTGLLGPGIFAGINLPPTAAETLV